MEASFEKAAPDSFPAATPSSLLLFKMKEDSAGRRDQGNVLSQVAHSLKMDGAAIQEAARGYGLEVEKRDIPKDELIEEIWAKIKLPIGGGCMACAPPTASDPTRSSNAA